MKQEKSREEKRVDEPGTHPSGSAVNSFFDQGNFEAMKTLSSWEAASCDEHHNNRIPQLSTDWVNG